MGHAHSLLRAALLVWIGTIWTGTLSPRAGEPLILRHAWTATDHPFRTALALFLLERALCPRGRQNRVQDRPKDERSLVDGGDRS